MSSVTRFSFAFACALFAASCNSAHVADSTETGNPPFLDAGKIALVVSADGARIVGQPGAVTPGGAEVVVENVSTGEVTHGEAEPDGSFDVALDATEDAVIEVSASQGGMQSGSVWVTRGGAMVGSGDGEELSCMQRTNLASQTLGSLLNNPRSSCQIDADCKTVPYRTVCTHPCGDAIVPSGEIARVAAAVEAVNEGLCSSFEADGCQVIIPPCVPPLQGPITCVAGRCEQQAERVPGGPACPSCLNRDVSWRRGNSQIEHRVSECEGYTQTTMTTTCEGQLPHCDGPMGPGPTVEQLLSAIAHPDVESALAEGGTIGGGPLPPGGLTSIQVDDRSFILVDCGGSSCPAGVQALATLLDRIENEVTCTP